MPHLGPRIDPLLIGRRIVALVIDQRYGTAVCPQGLVPLKQRLGQTTDLDAVVPIAREHRMNQGNIEIDRDQAHQSHSTQISPMRLLIAALRQLTGRVGIYPRVKVGRIIDDRRQIQAEFRHHPLGESSSASRIRSAVK